MAHEITKNERGYEFEVFSEASPYEALERLRNKIRQGLSRKYLIRGEGLLSFSHNKISGIIDPDGLVVDGCLVFWDDLKEMLSHHAGGEIEVKIKRMSD